jgi:hypothetical protein
MDKRDNLFDSLILFQKNTSKNILFQKSILIVYDIPFIRVICG